MRQGRCGARNLILCGQVMIGSSTCPKNNSPRMSVASLPSKPQSTTANFDKALLNFRSSDLLRRRDPDIRSLRGQWRYVAAVRRLRRIQVRFPVFLRRTASLYFLATADTRSPRADGRESSQRSTGARNSPLQPP